MDEGKQGGPRGAATALAWPGPDRHVGGDAAGRGSGRPFGARDEAGIPCGARRDSASRHDARGGDGHCRTAGAAHASGPRAAADLVLESQHVPGMDRLRGPGRTEQGHRVHRSARPCRRSNRRRCPGHRLMPAGRAGGARRGIRRARAAVGPWSHVVRDAQSRVPSPPTTRRSPTRSAPLCTSPRTSP